MNMTPVATSKPSARASVLTQWRRPGVDFDLPGEPKATLKDLLVLGGLFPLASIEDRLGPSRASLTRWSREGDSTELGRCFLPIRERAGAKALVILIDLQRLSEVLDHLVGDSQSS